MGKHKETAAPPEKSGRPKDWRDQIKADLAAQLEAGATLCGVRSDGACIARTKDGDRVLSRTERVRQIHADAYRVAQWGGDHRPRRDCAPRENPESWAMQGICVGARVATVCRVRALRPAWGPTAMR